MRLAHGRVSPVVASVLTGLCLVSSLSRAVSYVEDAPGVNGFSTVDKITWRDSKGLDRELYFAKSYPNSIVPQLMGYVTRLTWKKDATAPRIVAEEDPSGINAGNAQGWGTNVMHMHWLQYGGSNPYFGPGFSATTSKRDGFDFVQRPLFLGPHHLIFRVEYKQYTTLLKPGVERKWVKVTVDWFIADGVDHVVYAITIDASHAYLTDGLAFRNNTLAPYSLVVPATWKGTQDWAGTYTGAPDGQSFGDAKLFVTHDMANWTYGGVNTIPFIWQWVAPANGDAEAAYVQTETYAQKPAGEGFAGGTDASGTRLPVYPDLHGLEYSYQMNFFDGYDSKRLTWGTAYGTLYGGGGATPGYQNYSLALHLGRYSDHGAPSLIQETEGIHNGAVSVRALEGELLTSGPEGTGNPTPHLYSPAGYNHVYRTWELASSGNAVTVAFDLGGITFKRPVFVVHRYTGSEVGAVTVSLNGDALPGSGYSASIDEAADRLYVTLLSTLSGNNVIQISEGAAAPIDAGVPPVDAGAPPVDAGAPPPVDAGAPPPVDAGAPPPVDAGAPPPVDAGAPPPVDAGAPPPVDAGAPPPVDAGAPPVDAGAPPPADAGTPDAGAPPPVDAGTPDAGTLPPVDAGTPDAGTPPPADAGVPPVCTGDDDSDGVCDARDNCRVCWNPEQADADGDGLGDCWRCDWCSGPGTDTDYDGLCDGVDNCATYWNQSQRDTDGDGVGDSCDNCVSVANASQLDTNQNGVGDACEPSCFDLVRNGRETDVDCGGTTCAPCAVGLRCKVNSDCVPGTTCRSGRCR
ncbi:MAG: thrombospondin type 3 repeat-containing protein [Archangium sp.]|nr:thrombospondin type 3 repeat-containing protein [Archangium sp.]